MASTYFLGIDTGGTFTDSVLLDPQQRRIVKTAKVLTTPHDLRVCIGQVLEQIVPDGSPDAAVIRLVSLSTTLATNAIVEGKSRPVGLFLLGYDAALVEQYHFAQQFGTPHYVFLQGGMNLQGHEQAPLDEAGLAAAVQQMDGQVEAFAVSSYAGTLNGAHEERARDVIKQWSNLPVVQGHHLTSRLNSIRRATTASLNAGLLSTAYDFLNTVRAMLAERGIDAPLAMVRGDGSLVSAEFASHRPVEIIHSGPATSAIGGLYLAQQDSALVVDVGGTTTDLALLQNGQVVQDGRQATVGSYPTSVRTIRSRSFGLGGDSRISFDTRGEIKIGPERAIPLAYLGYAYPEARRDLIAWLAAAPEHFASDKLEFWALRREPRHSFRDARVNRVIELLRGGPRRAAWVIKQAGAISAMQVDADRLIREDIITRYGLTPTDLMHIRGEYAPWDADLARQVLECVAMRLGSSLEGLLSGVWARITRRMVAEIVGFLSGLRVPDEAETVGSSLAAWLFEQNMRPDDPFLGCQIQLKVPLIGIGAPARVFLDPVARSLGAQVLYPEHYAVANAVGTVVGNVLVHKEAEVLPNIIGTAINGYVTHCAGTQKWFEQRDEAVEFARGAIRAAARAEALAAGAREPEITLEEEEIGGGMLRLRAQALGKPGFGG